MRLIALPAFQDNYIWAIATDDGRALLVDPGQAEPVLEAAAQGLQPAAILLTHHHDDHIGGVAVLRERWPDLPVYAPDDPRIAGFSCERVGDGDVVKVLDWQFDTLAVPGHTRSHLAYVGQGHLFSGDTLFSLGCGRMFEGTPSQMLGSLQRLSALPGQTLVCCGHEYTLANAAFAVTVDPTNAALRQRHQEAQAMRHAARPTVPVTLASELATNPFLRTASAAIQQAIGARLGRGVCDEVEVFAELRRWKDDFRA
ncbi:hydroxyacylglutathione hydrolase [Xanthomonas sontii]|uniref:hydroxyacylglutathione hydrolase n=1 Tax=Xanthomonas sontii TaxID=2650745 RepID=UPI0011E44E7F|nr:hydroxyacylglutathione hydrolase [Xanthomonas sontii]MDQ7761348.1 hydroxyacylglutathione hydrolase [Xanthomonas sontii]TYD35217.1 hydroxyacylglutathione hydrolase [Xanthomonas sontii]UZK08163.1 hydroxyacylglutathione hydrolase [Xanthomonas sontii]